MNRRLGFCISLLGLFLVAGCQESGSRPVRERPGKSHRKGPRQVRRAPRKAPKKHLSPEPLRIVEEPVRPHGRRPIAEHVPPKHAHEPRYEGPPKGEPRIPREPRIKHRPKRPADSWVIFREAFDEDEDSECRAKWIEANRFKIETDNIQRMTIDMNKRPKGAPENGPWIFYVDGQGIELTGFKPRKRGYTGHKKDLVRSSNGTWSVDRRKLYRIGE